MKKIALITITTLSIVACDKAVDEFSQGNQNKDFTQKSVVVVGNDLYVFPSGDISGVADANNIESALNQVKIDGGNVILTDGDDTTTDHYYTSRNIVTNEFQGALVGESKNNTIIHAGRKSDTEGFESSISPWWAQTGGNSLLATVLQFDNAIGDVSVKNLSIIIMDDQPTNLQPDYYGDDATYITTFIEILGGEHDTYIENIRLEGKQTSAEGSYLGMNVAYGIHAMLGSPVSSIDKKGNLSIKNIEVENTGDGAVLFMRYATDSKITIEEVDGRKVGMGVWTENIFGSIVKIRNNDFSINTTGFPAIFAANITSGLEITNNIIKEPRYYGIALGNGTNNAQVMNNKFIDLNKGFTYAAILSRGSGNIFERNNFTKMNMPGIPAIILVPSTTNNYVHEMKFPPEINMSLCEMVWDFTDNPSTPEYDGQNEIHNYVACENLDRRDMKFQELEFARGNKKF